MRQLVFASAVAVLASAGFAHANTVTGSIYENDPTGAGDATLANVPAGTPDVTFTTTAPLNFASGGAYTIDEFLASSGPFTYLTGATHGGDTLLNTLFNFTGTVSVTQNETFTVGHDDGLTLVINGVHVIDAPGPTGFATTNFTWTGAAGTYAFQLVYGECCGAPGDLSVSLPLVSQTPLPAALPLFAGGFGLLGFFSRRRRRKTDQAELAVAI
jgi:hypothetical protein